MCTRTDTQLAAIMRRLLDSASVDFQPSPEALLLQIDSVTVPLNRDEALACRDASVELLHRRITT